MWNEIYATVATSFRSDSGRVVVAADGAWPSVGRGSCAWSLDTQRVRDRLVAREHAAFDPARAEHAFSQCAAQHRDGVFTRALPLVNVIHTQPVPQCFGCTE